MATVDPERWQALEPYLDRALDLPDDARREFVARLAIDQPQLARELEALLAESAAADRGRLHAAKERQGHRRERGQLPTHRSFIWVRCRRDTCRMALGS